MLSLNITDIKKLTAMLFTEDSFDRFLLHDAEFATAIVTEIHGEKNPDFYAEEERDKEMQLPCIPYKEIRPLALQLIKGSRLPLSFRIVLITSPEVTAGIVKNAGFTDCGISSLSLNIVYRNAVLSLTTGVSYQGFTLDKTLEQYWDKTVLAFLNRKDLSFEEL